MDEVEATAQAQISDAFHYLQTVLDKDLKLTQNPRQPKMPRREGAPWTPGHPGQQTLETPMLQCLKIMGQLILRHEQCMNVQRSTDCFILFFRQEPTGALKGMMEETQRWHQAKLAEPQKQIPPLRQQLMQTLLQNLLTKITRVSKTKVGDELYQASRERNLILEDMSWPFLRWDSQRQMLVVDQKTPITMGSMLKKVEELIEMFRVPSLVLRREDPTTPKGHLIQQEAAFYKYSLRM